MLWINPTPPPAPPSSSVLGQYEGNYLLCQYGPGGNYSNVPAMPDTYTLYRPGTAYDYAGYRVTMPALNTGTSSKPEQSLDSYIVNVTGATAASEFIPPALFPEQPKTTENQ